MKHYNWLTQNSKIAKISGIKTYNWGIPAYRSKDGFKTCPNAAACAKGCYATMGGYIFSNVAKVFDNRLKLSQSPDFVITIDSEIKRRKVRRLRIHDSGDFYSLAYFFNWRLIMLRNLQTKFYAYTKMIKMFNDLKQRNLIPDNLTLIYSYGGTQDKLINPIVDRHSTVFDSESELKQYGYADASKDDSVALGSNPRIGLIYHGVKNIENTNWGKVKNSNIKKTA
jgi:hypothetical protein